MYCFFLMLTWSVFLSLRLFLPRTLCRHFNGLSIPGGHARSSHLLGIPSDLGHFKVHLAQIFNNQLHLIKFKIHFLTHSIESSWIRPSIVALKNAHPPYISDKNTLYLRCLAKRICCVVLQYDFLPFQ